MRLSVLKSLGFALLFLFVSACASVGEDCANGTDDDNNGLVDCNDPICEGSALCGEDCANNLDDDGDGLVDCDDAACFSNLLCLSEICNNGTDDNNNGQIDCNDPDCANNPSCASANEICNNNADDDGDSFIDCNDSDCAAAPNCNQPGVENCNNGIDDDGDGLIDCNDGNCSLAANCQVGPTCGNGTLNTGETCDDGNTQNNDGCSAQCQIDFNAVNHSCDLPAGTQNGFGGCCNVDADCAGSGTGSNRACLFGYCTDLNCTADSQCNNANAAEQKIASPVPTGTTFKCVNFGPSGIINFCMAGSGQHCGDPNDPACPNGQTCTLAFNTETPLGGAVPSPTDGLGGVCTTNAIGSLPPGSFCTGESTYECSMQFFFNNCIGNTCTSACDFSEGGAATPACGAGLDCVGPLTNVFADPTFNVGGGGFCLGANCGFQTISSGGATEQLNLAACGGGSYCSLFGTINNGDDNLLYQCAPTDPAGAGLFAPCQQDAFFEQTCANSSLCLQNAPVQDTLGAQCFESATCCPNGPAGCTQACVGVGADANGNPTAGRCSPKGADGFCSQFCASANECAGGTCQDVSIGNIGATEFFIPLCIAP